jgi:hypothetical protein
LVKKRLICSKIEIPPFNEFLKDDLMKRLICGLSLVILFSGLSLNASAQYYFYNDSYYDKPVQFELGGSIGFMNCLTDLGGKKGIGKRFIKDLNFGNNNLAGGVYFSALYKYAIGLRLEAAFGKVSADDKVLESVPAGDIAKARYNRNLNFQSTISEFSLITELHPLFLFIDWESRDESPPNFSPYFLAGVGYFSFNPQANINGRVVDLQPLSTEGQGFKEYPDRKPYKLKQVNFPLGVGLKYELSSLINLRGEFVYRILNTDYLDDVSTNYIDPALFASNGLTGSRLNNALLLHDRQLEPLTGIGSKRGSPAEKDGFFSFNLKIGLAIGRERVR